MENLVNIIDEVDNIKTKITENEFLIITNQLKKVYDKISSLYEITYIDIQFSHLDANSYVAKPKEYKQIICLSDNETEDMKNGLVDTKNWLFLHTCDGKYINILDKLNFSKYKELIGVPDNTTEELANLIDVEINVNNCLVLTDLKKI